MEGNDYRILRTPLCPAVETDIEHSLDELKGGLSLNTCDFESINDIENLSWGKAVFWIFSSSISIYANKLLLLQRGFPLTISTFYFGLWLFTSIITSRYESRINVQSTAKGFQRTQSWFWMIPASLTSAAALPLLMEALMHMSSLPVLIMLFPLIHLIESLTLFIFLAQSRSSKCLSLETVGIAVFITLILYNEYRLTIPGIICGVGAFSMTGLSRAFFVMASHKMNDHGDQISSSYHSYILMTTTLGLLMSGFLAYAQERNILEFYSEPGTLALFSISSVTVVAAGFLAPVCSHIPKVLSRPRYIVSLDIPKLTFSSRTFWYTFNAVSTANYSIQPRVRLPKGYLFFVLKISFTTVAIVALYALSLSQLFRLQPGPISSMDNLYTPVSSSFDIAISAYKETQESIARMLKAIKSTPYLSSHNTRVLIYTKDPSVSLSMLKNSTGADTVERLPNLGREGGTYLSHIVTHWNDLAAQTMFIQAHAHNIRELIPRIDSYLVPQTGMLSLGFSESTCSCNNCGDRFGWTDDWAMVPSLYEDIYGSSCTNSTKILLSYKGQFIASARRIRGISRGIYEDLLSTITSESGWGHDSRFVKENDSPDNPSFGFAVERVWGLLMQCASNDRVSTKCPSLFSGMKTVGDVGDCQCLDSQ
ncbi:hypothetical protein BTUL_0011g00080 [Botrytis tulipae]|uniref:Uncharacterized protein n=1 Tax=Botrytis tulipae TaxID=87230 RepID=A0A4Z1F5X8_9HELO|nr:hypothetical protein BTUL_0011g00080 [Botrytis tulipae]